MSIESQERIIEAAQSGHLESFGILYKRYYSAMVVLAYALLGDKHLAEDTAQETFARACEQLTSLRHKDKFAAWLACICRNVAMQTLRSNYKPLPADTEGQTKDENDKEQLNDAVRHAVWKLRASDRELVVLRFYNGLSYEQISEILGISLHAVNGRLFRAKQKVAKHLKHNGFTGGDYETP